MIQRINWDDYLPPVNDTKKLVNLIFGICGSVFGVSMMGYLVLYFAARSELYTVWRRKKVLIEGARMPRYEEIVNGAAVFYYLTILLMAVLVVWLYFSYRTKESNGLYLMRRLPNQKELWKRCFTLPAAAAGLLGIFFLLYISISISMYLVLTPPGCHAEGTGFHSILEVLRCYRLVD